MEKGRWIVMMLAFLVYDLLLLGVNKLCGHPPNGWRAAIAAALGAIHAGMCLLPGLKFLGAPLWRLIFLALMAMIAYGMHIRGLGRGLVFAMLVGAMDAITNGGGWAVILAAVLVYFLSMFSKRHGRSAYQTVRITCGDRTVSVVALRDNGNTLRDPISGLPVVILDLDAAEKLLGLTSQQLRRPVQTVLEQSSARLRLIPYTAIGSPTGFLLGCRPDRVFIGDREEDVILAFAPQRIGQPNTFQALTGGYV